MKTVEEKLLEKA